MRTLVRCGLIWLIFSAIHSPPLSAQVFDEKYEHWPENLKIQGHVVVNNGLRDFAVVRPFLRRLVSAKTVVCVIKAEEPDRSDPLVTELRSAAGEEGEFRTVPFKPNKLDELKAVLRSADVVSIDVREDQADLIAKLAPECSAFVSRGGVLIAGKSWADRLGQYSLGVDGGPKNSGPSSAGESKGFRIVSPAMHLLPNCVLACADDEQSIPTAELLRILSGQPRTVGVKLDSAMMLVLSGRKMFCFGEGETTFCLPANEHTTARVESIAQRNPRQRVPWEFLVDLTEWRRDAIDRSLPPFPPAEPPVPQVKQGTLLIVGGGRSPAGLMERFVELAGGPDKAKLVYIPCTEAETVAEQQSTVRMWRRMGVKHATFLHTKNRKKANKDSQFSTPLNDATGIWFGGGRQWNFSDSYYGTTTHKLMKDVLLRGGVIGGSSAGASIQARYLARATPIGNTRIMAPGYERGGLGFIGGVAIDQHFSQRSRQKDMTSLMSRHPQLLGIGIDESTAIEVQGTEAKVFGRGRVFFYDRQVPPMPGKPDYTALPAGAIYDLKQRRVVLDAGAIRDSAVRAVNHSASNS